MEIVPPRIVRKLVLFLMAAATCPAQNPAVTVQVDATANRRAINPNIYGVAYATQAQLADLNAPVHRMGGNNTTRYNWQVNGDNRGNDWYFESIADSSALAGERGDSFITLSKAGGAQPMITIPVIGWVAKLGSNRGKLASFSQAKYGAQTGNDWQWFADAGNGILQSTGNPITGNDPNDANTPNSSALQQAWVQAIVNRWGSSSQGGLRYYILDNEHSIWHSTHRDVHPAGATMEEIRARMLEYAAAIKNVDPSAQVVGPEEWGWSGYLLSGADQDYGSKHGWSYMPDRSAHGNMDYLPWLLDQLRSDGRHLLDVFSVHYYPQGGEFGDDTSTSMQLRRNRSTRSLWDPNYTDETWINDKVKLIPRLRQWADTYYAAGTPIAITEYNWGAENHINGATTQADIYGIFGREGLDIGARWTTPATSTPTYKAMKMYRNYDGAGSTFGETSLSATVPNPDNLAAFAAQRTADGALTVMVISKVLSGATPVTVALSHFSGSGAAHVYQLTSANAINHLADIAYNGGSLNATVPAQSITLFVLPQAAGPPPFGSFDTPTNNSTGVAGSIAVTGWALDSVGVTKVDIWREPNQGEATQTNGLVYIGDAVFVAGARPDVATAYPSYPNSTRAGWGYLMLTNFLPSSNGTAGTGNGTYRLHAIAHNQSGGTTDLGTRTITCDNAHAAKPFGAIDTPAQGETISGSAYVNFGWALTPQPGAIPTNGSTIQVYIDGAAVGTVTYNNARSDIDTLFPGYANTGGAVGYRTIDTTKLSNGMHSLAWSVTDNLGRTDGIGSRYFFVLN
jgi:hypothetical protein